MEAKKEQERQKRMEETRQKDEADRLKREEEWKQRDKELRWVADGVASQDR